MSNDPEIKDGFRKRKVRPKGWLKQAIKDGSVRDPKLGPNPHGGHPEGATVVEAPIMTIEEGAKNGRHR